MLGGAPDHSHELYLSDKREEPTGDMLAERVPSILGHLREAPEFAAAHSEPLQDQMVLVGELGPARQAWCKWWDRRNGCGVLTDLDDGKPVAVVSSALTTGANVSSRLKYLRSGEFVDYRRVEGA